MITTSRPSLNSADKIADTNIERFGDSGQGIQRDIDKATLDITQIRGSKFSSFRKLLLSELIELAVKSDLLANDLPMTWLRRHAANGSRKGEISP
jgi:hypothetical protein